MSTLEVYLTSSFNAIAGKNVPNRYGVVLAIDPLLSSYVSPSQLFNSWFDYIHHFVSYLTASTADINVFHIHIV